jgi:hypothetical protein
VNMKKFHTDGIKFSESIEVGNFHQSYLKQTEQITSNVVGINPYVDAICTHFCCTDPRKLSRQECVASRALHIDHEFHGLHSTLRLPAPRVSFKLHHQSPHSGRSAGCDLPFQITNHLFWFLASQLHCSNNTVDKRLHPAS